MNILCVGGGPAASYFSILAKQAFPQSCIQIFERNPEHHRSGWGIIIPHSLLSLFKQTDQASFDYLESNSWCWDTLQIVRNDEKVSISDSGRAVSRNRFSNFLLERAASLGVEIKRPEQFNNNVDLDCYDLVVWADGAGSQARTSICEPSDITCHKSSNWFLWLGTAKLFNGMSFIFKSTPYGPIWSHAYPFEEGLSTFIIECTDSVYRGMNFSSLSEEECVSLLTDIFRDELGEQKLQTLKVGGYWRTFNQVHTKKIAYGNQIILGDAAHTAHFSIGSGTRLAIEDAYVAVQCLAAESDSRRAVYEFSRRRTLEALKIQAPALNSMRFFDKLDDFFSLDIKEFSRALMFRSVFGPAIENPPSYKVNNL